MKIFEHFFKNLVIDPENCNQKAGLLYTPCMILFTNVQFRTFFKKVHAYVIFQLNKCILRQWTKIIL